MTQQCLRDLSRERVKEMLVEKECKVNDILLNYVEGPNSGTPLLFLHGLSARWQSGISLIPYFTSRYHVFALDFRGHGKSGRAPGHYSVDDYISDTSAFIKENINEPLIIFGHSLGGRVAVSLAVDMPDHVEAIIVGETPLSSKSMAAQSNFRAVIKKWHDLVLSGLSVDELAAAIGDMPAAVPSEGNVIKFKELSGWDQTYLRFTARYLKMVDPEILLSLEERDSSAAYDIENNFSKILCPVLFIQGDHNFGALMTDEDLNNALSNIKCASFVKIPGVGHDIHLQNAEPVHRAMMYFLESL